MEYPEISDLHLKNIKKTIVTGPDDVKGELYRALGISEIYIYI